MVLYDEREILDVGVFVVLLFIGVVMMMLWMYGCIEGYHG